MCRLRSRGLVIQIARGVQDNLENCASSRRTRNRRVFRLTLYCAAALCIFAFERFPLSVWEIHSRVYFSLAGLFFLAEVQGNWYCIMWREMEQPMLLPFESTVSHGMGYFSLGLRNQTVL